MTEDPAAPEAGPEAGVEAAPEPPVEPEPTLQEEFAALRPELGQSMLGKPAQLVTGLLIGAVLLVGLLIGLTTLAKDGALPLTSPAGPAPTASAAP